MKQLKDDGDSSVEWIDLRDINAPNFDGDTIFQSDAYKRCHQTVLESDGLLLAIPVYNWGCCAELKSPSNTSPPLLPTAP